MSIGVDLSMTIGGRGVCVEVCLVQRLGVLSAVRDVSLVVTTVGSTVCVEAWLVWGCRLLSASDDVSLVCTESVIVLASTVATLG